MFLFFFGFRLFLGSLIFFFFFDSILISVCFIIWLRNFFGSPKSCGRDRVIQSRKRTKCILWGKLHFFSQIGHLMWMGFVFFILNWLVWLHPNWIHQRREEQSPNSYTNTKILSNSEQLKQNSCIFIATEFEPFFELLNVPKKKDKPNNTNVKWTFDARYRKRIQIAS